MLKVGPKEVNVEELMEKIRSEIERGRQKTELRASTAGSSAIPSFTRFREQPPHGEVSPELRVPRYPQPPPVEHKSRYALNEILNYSDKSFIKTAYRAILKREPDQEGYEYHLDQLRSGHATKIAILRNLHQSPEGREKGVVVDGLFRPALIARLSRVPVLGYMFKWVISVIRLPSLNHGVQSLMAATEAKFTEQAEMSNRIADVIDARLAQHEKRLEDTVSEVQRRLDRLARDAVEQSAAIGKLDRTLSQRIDTLSADAVEQSNAVGAVQHDLTQRVERIDCQKADVEAMIGAGRRIQNLDELVREQIERLSDLERASADSKRERVDIKREYIDYKYNMLGQQSQLRELVEEARARLPGALDGSQVNKLSEEGHHLFDALYAAFEDRFRGTREEIKKRQRVYLPDLEASPAGKNNAPVLDLGCGRGEWLELLQEQGYRAKGLDLNRVMVRRCQELSLDVSEADATLYLREQPADSLGAVTGFHIIEHVSFYSLVALLDATLRALAPGGVAIFETPNPENLMVGAYLFYSDMDHRNPLVPDSVQFLAEERGFENVTIKRLHDRREWMDVGNTSDFEKRWFYSEQDYALIAHNRNDRRS